MTALTTKYQIQYAVLGDTIASLAGTLNNLAQRVDLLLGESGTWVPSMTAGTAASQAVTLARTYPGNVGAAVPGIVLVQYQTPMASGVIVQHWVTGWTGTASTITGFTLNAISSTTTARTFLWRFIPVL